MTDNWFYLHKQLRRCHRKNKKNWSCLLAISAATEGLQSYVSNYFKTMGIINGTVLADYVITTRSESNVSDTYRRETIKDLFTLSKSDPSLHQFLERSVRAGLQLLHQISCNTFSLHLLYLELNFLTISPTLLLSVISLPLADVSTPFTEIFNIGSSNRFLYQLVSEPWTGSEYIVLPSCTNQTGRGISLPDFLPLTLSVISYTLFSLS